MHVEQLFSSALRKAPLKVGLFEHQVEQRFDNSPSRHEFPVSVKLSLEVPLRPEVEKAVCRASVKAQQQSFIVAPFTRVVCGLENGDVREIQNEAQLAIRRSAREERAVEKRSERSALSAARHVHPPKVAHHVESGECREFVPVKQLQ